MRETFQEVASPDGTTIAFDRLGDGPPVIVVWDYPWMIDVGRRLAEAMSNGRHRVPSGGHREGARARRRWRPPGGATVTDPDGNVLGLLQDR
jgi:hypothetical protein